MSDLNDDLNDTLVLELLDLARCQRAALKEGRLDEALSLIGKRKVIIDRIQVVGRLTEIQKMAVREILSIDADISSAVRCGMTNVASRIDGIGKIRTYLQNVSSTAEGEQAGVSV